MLKIEAILDDFLACKDRKVLILKGKWGIGKTYFWKKYINNKIEKDDVDESVYSYVSLFGAKSMEDIKGKIFESGYALKDNKFIKTSFQDNIRPLVKYSKYLKIFPNQVDIKNINSMIESAVINKYLICFDDIERKKETVSIPEILGLSSIFKEEKNCRIVFILNEEELSPSDKSDLDKFREKVVDVEIAYDPTLINNFNLIFRKEDKYSDFCLEKIEILNIKNIRVLNKIYWSIKYFEGLIKDFEDSIKEEVLSHIVLISCAHYCAELKITTEFLRGFNMYSGLFKKDEEAPEIRDKKAKLREYGYDYLDYDSDIINYINNGYIDKEAFLSRIIPLNDREKISKIREQLYVIGNLYGNNFQHSQEEYINAMKKFLDKHAVLLSMDEFNDIKVFLGELGEDVSCYRDTIIRANIDKYALNYLDGLLTTIKDSEIADLIQEKISTKKSELQIKNVLAKMAKNQSWNEEDIVFLASCSVDDYYEWLKTDDDDKLRMSINMGLKFKEGGETEKYRQISNLLEEALKKIGQRSAFDRLRVENLYKVTVPVAS